MFVIEFQNGQDLRKVINGRPWMFDRNLLCLPNYDSLSIPQDIIFNNKPMWVQLYNIPLGKMTINIGKQIRKVIEEVEQVDVDKAGTASHNQSYSRHLKAVDERQLD